jgi:hypothetical protein
VRRRRSAEALRVRTTAAVAWWATSRGRRNGAFVHCALSRCVRVPDRSASFVVFRGGGRGRSWVIVCRWRTGWRSAISQKGRR